MDLNNIERNKLDYLLTDILPAELPETFTYKYFYEYLFDKSEELSFVENEMIKKKNKHNDNSKNRLFEGPVWANAPLKYTIMKGQDGERQISLLHPISAMEILLFVSTYQKELLHLLEENAVFSLRYHHRNNDLCYKNKNKSFINYFDIEAKNIKRDVLEHTGMFFDIKPYNSIKNFTTSEEWMVMNSKYKYFAKTDYKACFDSIYTHAYTWITANSVTDTRFFYNTNIYTTIDRLLMNINSRSSNGIVVGPEFSRMMAELLLQRIDIAVYNKLLNSGFSNGIDYNVFRYVDDVFIFAKSEDLINAILESFSEEARRYLLSLNELKLEKSKVPFILEPWHKETNLYTYRASSFIFKSTFELKEERQQRAEEGKEKTERICILKARNFLKTKSNLISHFNDLICTYNDKSRIIVSYVLGMMLNKVSRNKDSYSIFREDVSANTVFALIDFIMYVYSFFPDFNNTQKLLGILSYIKDEYDFTKNDNEEGAQKVFSKYAFVFDKSNINDLVNLILFFRQVNVEIPYNYECKITDRLIHNDNPLLWATYLLYSTYNKRHLEEVIALIEEKINNKIDAIRSWNEAYIYKEFWWIIIFNKCPYLSTPVQSRIDDAIDKIAYKDGANKPSGCCNSLFIDFLKNNNKQFYEWDLDSKNILREITFKTHERSVFKNYGNNLNYMNWTSIN